MITLPTHEARKTAASAGQRGTSLVELLVAMSILAVVTAMILTVWFGLQRSYSFSVRSSETREIARDGMSRMVREIRDSGGRVGSAAGTGIVAADRNFITLRTAFNVPRATSVRTDGAGDGPDYLPPLSGFYYEWNSAKQRGTIYRWRDTDGIIGLSKDDRRDELVTNVVKAPATPVFTYTCINTTGGVLEGVLPGAPYSTNTPTDLTSIVSVQITLRVDLNPGKSPEYMDLISTAQPRNNRQT